MLSRAMHAQIRQRRRVNGANFDDSILEAILGQAKQRRTQIARHPSINNGPVRWRARNIDEIISFPRIHPSIAHAHESVELFDGLSSPLSPFLSLFFPPLLSFSLDGTPRLRGKSDIFRHGIWRSNDARAKLSTSIRLFVPNWPSATPATGAGTLAVIGKCLFVLIRLDLFPSPPAKFVTHLPIYIPSPFPSRYATPVGCRT